MAKVAVAWFYRNILNSANVSQIIHIPKPDQYTLPERNPLL